ncbi:MAG: hypothetical protein AB1457_06955 [Chloroflexota bacterium]
MHGFPPFNLLTLPSGQASVESLPENVWILAIPAGPAGSYRVAQLDDYRHLPRNRFRWQPPLTLSLTAQVSSSSPAGTWGFGFWNDPFSFSIGAKGSARRLPVLPNAAWFFYASPENHLSLRDDLPANGLLAAVFRSPLIPSAGLIPALFALPLLTIPATSRWLRLLARFVIQQDAARLDVEVTRPHAYRLEWRTHSVRFYVEGQRFFETPLTPRGRLGLVIWIDNQYAAFTPDGNVRFGLLPNETACLRITGIQTALQN